MSWALEIAFHWPHDRFAVGIETMRPDEECDCWTIVLYLFVVTLSFNFK